MTCLEVTFLFWGLWNCECEFEHIYQKGKTLNSAFLRWKLWSRRPTCMWGSKWLTACLKLQSDSALNQEGTYVCMLSNIWNATKTLPTRSLQMQVICISHISCTTNANWPLCVYIEKWSSVAQSCVSLWEIAAPSSSRDSKFEVKEIAARAPPFCCRSWKVCSKWWWELQGENGYSVRAFKNCPQQLHRVSFCWELIYVKVFAEVFSIFGCLTWDHVDWYAEMLRIQSYNWYLDCCCSLKFVFQAYKMWVEIWTHWRWDLRCQRAGTHNTSMPLSLIFFWSDFKMYLFAWLVMGIVSWKELQKHPCAVNEVF